MKALNVITLFLLCHQGMKAYWHDSNELELSSIQRQEKYEKILANISAQLESLKKELHTSESQPEAKNKLIQLRTQIAAEKTGVKNGTIKLGEEMHRKHYAGGLQIYLDKIEDLLHPKPPAKPMQYWHNGNELELNNYERWRKYNNILDARTHELNQMIAEFKKHGATPTLKNQLIDLHDHLDHEIRGLNQGNIRMVEPDQRSLYRGGLQQIKGTTEDLLKKMK